MTKLLEKAIEEISESSKGELFNLTVSFDQDTDDELVTFDICYYKEEKLFFRMIYQNQWFMEEVIFSNPDAHDAEGFRNSVLEKIIPPRKDY